MKKLALSAAMLLALGVTACSTIYVGPTESPAAIAAREAKTMQEFAEAIFTDIRQVGDLSPIAAHLRMGSGKVPDRKLSFEEDQVAYSAKSSEERAAFNQRMKKYLRIDDFLNASWQEAVVAMISFEFEVERVQFLESLTKLNKVRKLGQNDGGTKFSASAGERRNLYLTVNRDEATGAFYITGFNAHPWPRIAEQEQRVIPPIDAPIAE